MDVSVNFKIEKKDDHLIVYHDHISHDTKIKIFDITNIANLMTYIEDEIQHHLIEETKV